MGLLRKSLNVTLQLLPLRYITVMVIFACSSLKKIHDKCYYCSRGGWKRISALTTLGILTTTKIVKYYSKCVFWLSWNWKLERNLFSWPIQCNNCWTVRNTTFWSKKTWHFVTPLRDLRNGRCHKSDRNLQSAIKRYTKQVQFPSLNMRARTDKFLLTHSYN